MMFQAKFLQKSQTEILTFCIWAAMVLWLMTRHVIWADEARAWLIATRTPDWAAMFAQAHSDGHPVLWYVFLRAASSVHNSIASLYAVQFFFAALAAGFCLALKNVPLTFRILLVFGGILGYEYAVVARNYAPAAAAILAYAYFYPQRNERPALLGLLLGFALNVHAGTAPIIPFLLLPWISEWRTTDARALMTTVALTALGFATLLLSIYPPFEDSIFIGNQIKQDRNILLDSLPAQQLIPLITAGLDDILDLDSFAPLSFRIGLSFFAVLTCWYLFRTPQFRLAALGLVLGTSAFYGLTYPVPAYRHGAFLFMGLLGLLAMQNDGRQQTVAQKAASLAFAIFAALLFGRLILAIAVPFSNSTEVSHVLNDPEFKSARVLCLPEWTGQTIAALGHRDCMMAFVGRTGPFPLFLLRDYVTMKVTLSELIAWMRTNEMAEHPALIHLHTTFVPKPPEEPDDFGWRHRKGRRFQLLATQAETKLFLDMTEFLTTPKPVLSPDASVLLRLKPEYRTAPFPSDSPRTDP